MGAGGFTSHADMLGVSGQITTGALTRRTAGGSAGCRNLHRGMRLASGGGLLNVLRLRGLPVMGWSQWQQCYDSLTAIIYISLSLSLLPPFVRGSQVSFETHPGDPSHVG